MDENLCKPRENIDIEMRAKLYVFIHKRSPKFKESFLKSVYIEHTEICQD